MLGRDRDFLGAECPCEKIKTTGNTNGIAFTKALQTRDFEGLAFVNLVQYSTKKNFSGDKKTLYVSSGKATGNIKTAKGGRTYYVRLRPYTTVGNTRYYGSYTAARAVRVK